MPNNRFNDKVAIVTGGASGIGRGLCEELGRRGAIVAVADINAAGAEEVSATITRCGGRGHGLVLDVSSVETVPAFARSHNTQLKQRVNERVSRKTSVKRVEL